MHNTTVKYCHYEKMKSQIKELNTESEDDQVQIIINSTLKNPTQTHRIAKRTFPTIRREIIKLFITNKNSEKAL